MLVVPLSRWHGLERTRGRAGERLRQTANPIQSAEGGRFGYRWRGHTNRPIASGLTRVSQACGQRVEPCGTTHSTTTHDQGRMLSSLVSCLTIHCSFHTRIRIPTSNSPPCSAPRTRRLPSTSIGSSSIPFSPKQRALRPRQFFPLSPLFPLSPP